MGVFDARIFFRGLRIFFSYVVLWFCWVDTAASQAFVDIDKIEGANACAECHKHEAEVWKGTHHFKTFRIMPRSKEAKEIADKMQIKRIKSKSLCLNCHFTSRKKAGRPKPISGISCESCHAAGKDYIKRHAEFSGAKKKELESKEQAAKRWKDSEAAGMIRPATLYKLAKNCYSCHVVPQEKLVNIGGHPAGSKFELVSWSQGEVRHNLWYSKGKTNTNASQNRRRMMYVVGIAVELETALRAVGVATKRKNYAFEMAQRAAIARKNMAAIARAVSSSPELIKIAKLGYIAGLKLNNNAALTAAANGIAAQIKQLLARYDGSTFTGVDNIIPGPDKYKGAPVK